VLGEKGDVRAKLFQATPRALAGLRELDPAARITKFPERAPFGRPQDIEKAGERATTRMQARELIANLDENVCTWTWALHKVGRLAGNFRRAAMCLNRPRRLWAEHGSSAPALQTSIFSAIRYS
jgi:hypothetical protein